MKLTDVVVGRAPNIRRIRRLTRQAAIGDPDCQR